MSLFVSDDDSNYSDHNSGENGLFGKIDINSVFEGASGRKRLQLQSQFHGDCRFNLTEDFMSDRSDEISRALSEEKAIYSNQCLVTEYSTKLPETPEWEEIRRFGPEAPMVIGDNFPTKNLATSMPVVPKDVRIEIKADLKRLFTPNAMN
ncbi:10586_t:CDS:2, partial [Paraglomus occultum]